VRSPVRGTIKQINLNTIGGVVRPGESILEIVPLDDTLLVEARIRPADIAFLHPGQKAMIKITAYDFSLFGGLEGFLEAISADTIEEDNGESFFKVKLRTQKNAISYRGEDLPIIPGMTASIDILTGKKSVLAYLLKPILRAKQNALRER
jgi:adhesin transport system membrane fusion protein